VHADHSDEFTEAARELDRLLAHAREQGGETARLVEDVLEASETYTRAGLVDLVTHLRADPVGEDLLVSALESPAVMALLVRHRIVRGGRPLEVLGVLETLRPYLVASGADVEVVDLDDETAVLRLAASTGQDGQALQEQIEQALLTRVPGLGQVSWADPATDPAFVPVESLLRRP
jgi:hypothetical protein